MIAIVDYGVGNLFSLVSSFRAVGEEPVITSDPKILEQAEKIILPGVGAFEDAKQKLVDLGLDRCLRKEVEKGKKLFGICLGMQLLFEKSYEYGEHEGLGLLKGSIIPMRDKIDTALTVPHIGWNFLKVKKEHPIFKYVNENDYVYFVHSYFAADCDESLLATTEYGIELTAAAALRNVAGTQFHPEKSGDVGLKILKAVCEW